MRLLALLAVTACLVACAEQQSSQTTRSIPFIPEGDVFTLYGDRHVMSDADFEAALDVVRSDTVKRYGSEFPITRVYVIDRNHITVRYWPKDRETWAQVQRVAGRWKLVNRSNQSLQPTAGRSDE